MATRIGISGSYGGLNVGDEAILTCMLAELRAHVPDVEIVVFSRDARHTAAHHDVERVIPVRQSNRERLEPELARLDLLLLGGGGLLFDGEAPVFLREVRIAQQLGVPTMTYAIGAGPLERPEDRRAVQATLSGMDRITVREDAARRVLEEVGVAKEIITTADPALLLRPEPFTESMLAREGIDPDRPLVGMSVREPGKAAPDLEAARYQELMANVADCIVSRYRAGVVFIPMEAADVDEAHQVIAHMTNAAHATVLGGPYRPGQVLGLMEYLEMAVGMRLHFVIFAALAAVPVLPLPYAGKITSMLDRLELPGPEHVQEEGPDAVLAQLGELWNRRAETRAGLPERVRLLQAEARQSTREVLDLLSAAPNVEGRPGPNRRRDDARPGVTR
jgi:polysaccharide pyruvyl transferase CsaB